MTIVFLSFSLTAIAQNFSGSLETILNSDGSIQGGQEGSFDASGFEMRLEPSGEPVFVRSNEPALTQSTIEWSKVTPGDGAEIASNSSTTINSILITGTDIYIGGQFRSIMNVRSNGIAKWDGSAWHPVGTGVDGYVNALEHDGTNLYAAGSFTKAGGVVVVNVAMWNGTAWSALGDGLNSVVFDLEIFQGKLYAGGYFTGSGSTLISKIAVWNGSSWGNVGTNMVGNLMGKYIYSLEGTGNSLYAGGIFTNIGGITAYSIAAWDGSNWQAMGSGFLNGTVRSILNINGAIFAGGTFSVSGTIPLNNIARWNVSAWQDISGGVNGPVISLATDGINLFAGGGFGMAGGITATRVAKWNGTSWSAISTSLVRNVNAVAFDGSTLYSGGSANEIFGISDGSTITFPDYKFDLPNDNISIKSLCMLGNSLYVGGAFTTIDGTELSNIGRWDGTNWHALGTGANSTVNALATDGTHLYAGGNFNSIGGISSSLAKWDGTSWSNVGEQNLSSGGVSALLWHNGTLYAAGDFIYVGGTNIRRVAAFDGSNWYGFGEGFDAGVSALAHDGITLYAGGGFTTSGGVSARRVAKWNGSTWDELGTGLDNSCYSLLFHSGNLYAGGYFTSAGGVIVKNIAKWNGVVWSAMGDGVGPSSVYSLAEMNGDIYAGGAFTSSGLNTIKYLAKWNGVAWSDAGSSLDGAVFAILPSWHYQSFLVGGQFISFDETTLSKRIAKFTDSDNPLPVELVSFSGRFHDKDIHLNWQTATEVDNIGFEVERKTAVSDWMKIVFIEGHGTSNSPKYYSFEDHSITPGEKYLYRLKQIDGDGSFTHSGTIEISSAEITDFILEQNYPNPFNPATVIRFSLPLSGNVKLEVFDSKGERVAVLMDGFRESGVHSAVFDATELSSGVYLYTLSSGGLKLIRKMLLVR